MGKKANKEQRKIDTNAGITLVALVVTIVVLLILAGITLVYVFGDNGVFGNASRAKIQTEIAKAREKLEVVLSEAKIYKYTEPKYNENEYLDEMILNKVSGSKVQGDVVISDGYAFTLDRSIPWIGEYVGKEEELVFPEINIENPEYDEDYRTAKLKIRAIEKENGISKIEILQHGKVIETFKYENEKEQIPLEYIAKQNGIYTVKAYSKLIGTERKAIKDLVMSVEFSPNGNNTYKKEHQVKVTVKENTDKIKSLKYQWTTSLTEPSTESFQKSCNNGSLLINNNITGTYYLWMLLETESGKINICRSEAFNFDNKKPKIESFLYNADSATKFSLECSAVDEDTEIEKYELYINGKKETEITKGLAKISFNEVKSPDITYEIKVYDMCGNFSTSNITNKENIFIWKKYELVEGETIYTRSNKVWQEEKEALASISSEWSLSDELVAIEGGCQFASPGSGRAIDALRAGKTVYTHNGTSTMNRWRDLKTASNGFEVAKVMGWYIDKSFQYLPRRFYLL